ncbi:MAG TPA: hypothetical protein VLM05_07705 [Mycobacteriales bacterium]|nr:hypothetical protein [Mycobacteriales bacterium]
MRPIRVLLTVSAAALVAAACGDDSPPAAAGSSAPAAPTSAAASSGSASSGSASGSGTAGLPAADILARTRTAFKAAKSVHVTGGGTSGQDTFKVDMRYSAAGNAIGTVTNGGETIELRRVGQVVYLKASTAFWTATAGAKAATAFGGKYVKAPVTDQRVAAVVSLTDKGAFIDAALSTTGGVEKGATKTVNGTQAIPLTIKDSAGGSTLFVAATGEPLPLEVLPQAGGTDTGKVDFLDYGVAVNPAAPPAAQTVDVSVVPGR